MSILRETFIPCFFSIFNTIELIRFEWQLKQSKYTNNLQFLSNVSNWKILPQKLNLNEKTVRWNTIFTSFRFNIMYPFSLLLVVMMMVMHAMQVKPSRTEPGQGIMNSVYFKNSSIVSSLNGARTPHVASSISDDSTECRRLGKIMTYAYETTRTIRTNH